MDAFFFFKRIVGALVQPLPIFILFLVLAALLRLLGKRRAALASLIAGVVLILLCSQPLTASRAARLLESRYPPLTGAELPSAPPAAIVVLGSAVAHPGDSRLPAVSRLSDIARARLFEGIRLARLYPDAAFITSGFGVFGASCADVTAEAAIELGIDSGRILRFAEALDTEDEARLTREAVKDGERVILVTSAAHMPRSMFLFRERGIDAVAAPCDFIAPVSDDLMANYGPRIWLPTGRRITEHEIVWHEALGWMYLSWFRGLFGR